MAIRPVLQAMVLIAVALVVTAPAHSETIEEIVAWIDGEIITMSDLEQAEQEMMQELYRKFTGEELDDQVRESRKRLLEDMIDHKILLNRAERLFVDMEMVGNSFLSMFKEHQKITSDKELEEMLAEAGMTVAELKQQLVENFAPAEVIRMEVTNRVSVSDGEISGYYEEHQDEFVMPAEVKLREIVLLSEESEREERRAEAERVRARAVEPDADLAELAKEHSDAGTASSGGILGPLKKGELSERLDDLAFTLAPGEVSEVQEMSYGFHIVVVEERTEERARGLDEVRDEIQQMLSDRKYQRMLREFLETAREEATWRVNPKYREYLAKTPES